MTTLFKVSSFVFNKKEERNSCMLGTTWVDENRMFGWTFHCRILMKHYIHPINLCLNPPPPCFLGNLVWNGNCKNKNGPLFGFHGDFKRKLKDDTRLCSCTLIKIHCAFLLSLNNRLIIDFNQLVKIRAPAVTQRLSIAALFLIWTLRWTLFLYCHWVSFVHRDDQSQC